MPFLSRWSDLLTLALASAAVPVLIYLTPARHDSLISLHNRRAFKSILEDEIATAELENKRVALLYIDLNGFKRINDSFGHAAGDTVLQVVAQRLTQAYRYRYFPDDAQQADVLVRSADAAMHTAKRLVRSGRSRFRQSDKVEDSLSYEAVMRKALEEGQLEMH